MYSVPSKDLVLFTRPFPSSFYGGSFSHRLKHLQKSDRRANISEIFLEDSWVYEIFSATFHSCSRGTAASHIMSSAQDIIGPSESSTDPPDSACHDSGYLSMNDLKNCLNEFVNIENFEIATRGFSPSPEGNDISNEEKEVEHNQSHGRNSNIVASEKHFSKCATFPSPASPGEHKKFPAEVLLDGKAKQGNDITTVVSTLNGDAESADQSYSRCISLPTPMKLVSAMKGSREKQGIPPKKLIVTWAPDVYDPVPSAVPHVASNKHHRHRSDSRKYSKTKQKGSGKSSRGSKGKDKKQARKTLGSASSSFKSFNDYYIMHGFDEPLTGIENFDVGNPVAFCGSSFLKKPVSKLHFAVTEAT
ncbi:unnamed protein product [Fraxinus pennsylvanica]|uniref:Uncharacterized protein n=1 Tax=Fraxinus pennsylvanica TaxID=56036 RepID=A0AAD2A3E8_9LAMI|nr:unnamed protein product [Fraxinus pennsylvanica]